MKTFGRILIVVMVGMTALGCAKKAPPPPQSGPVPVTVAHPLVVPLVEWDRYTGRMSAVQSVDVRARVSGSLDTIHFADGEIVEKDALLFVVDPRPFENALENAKAMLAEAEAKLVRDGSELDLAKAESAQSAAMKSLAETRLDRAKQAVAGNSIAREQVDVRESELAQATASVASANAAIASAAAGVESAKAAIGTAKVAVERAELDLSYTRIKSPIKGRIGRHLVSKGNLIDGGSAGGTLLATIVSCDPIYCDFDANEREFLKYVRLAQEGRRKSARVVKHPIFLALSDERGYPHRGYIDFVDNRIDPNTGTLRARAILANPDLILTPGLFATVRIPGGERQNTILIPDAAVIFDQSDRIVYVLDQNDVVAVRKVTVGPLALGLRIIRNGLEVGDRVVINGLQRIRAGTKTAPKLETITAVKSPDDLPDDYSPVPKEEWLDAAPDPAPDANGKGGDKK